jgi:mannose-6-phosphate isomerase-like protein (cupin superfamily)
LADYAKVDHNMCFRSTNLMINILAKRQTPRDVTKLSPHSHVDFEQASVVIQGTYVHHLRYPWTADMTAWREDEHLEMGTPSVLIIPPTVIHTSRNIGGPGWLVDVFGPPRLDFSQTAGLVCNADEYPMPAVN